MGNGNILDIKVKNYGECGHCKDQKKEQIIIPASIYGEWLFTMQSFGSKEFGAVLRMEGNRVVDYEFPKQECTSSNVSFKEDLGGEGVMHSHHSMGAFHSGTDDASFRNLYGYSIVISHSGTTASRKIDLPCGGFGHIPAEVIIEGMESKEVPVIAPTHQVTYYRKEEKTSSYLGRGYEYPLNFGSFGDTLQDNRKEPEHFYEKDDFPYSELSVYYDLEEEEIICLTCGSQIPMRIAYRDGDTECPFCKTPWVCDEEGKA